MSRRFPSSRYIVLSLLLAALGLAGLIPGRAWGGEAEVVKVMATVRESPPRITLDWPRVVNSGGFKVYRKSMEAKSWGSIYATIPADTATSFVDDNVAVGVGYEYNIETVRTMDDAKGHGYIYSGIALPPVDSRGKVILLVDASMAAALPGEIERLEWDLAGDGWTILRHDVPHTSFAGTSNEVSAIKTIIRNDYNSDTNNVKCVFLVGRVAFPKVHGGSPDGHSASTWLNADTHYSMPDVDWSGVGDPIPSMMKLDVGRVDFYNAADVFQLSEAEVLRRYLNKHHAFRNRLAAFQTRSVNSGGWHEDHWKAETWVGRDKREEGRFQMIEHTPALWDHAEGLNYGDSASASLYASHKFQSVFGMSGGSGAWNYDAADSVLLPSLASSGANLAHVYSYSPTRFFHWMALGSTLGTSERLATANYNIYYGSHAAVHRGLCGDPTLRMHILAPPSGLSIVGSTLTWDASPDAGTDGFSGYHVYRGSSRAGPFIRHTTNLVIGTTWTDLAPSNAIYQVRAIRLETTSVGSYYNNSAGAFATRGQVGIVPNVRWLNVPEARTAMFQVKLSAQPASNVTVTAARTGGDSDISVKSGGSLIFTPANWNVYQPVTLAAARDVDRFSNEDQPVDGPASISLSAPGLSNVTVGATEEDLFIETRASQVYVPENGSVSIAVRLSGPPVGNVTVTSTIQDTENIWMFSIPYGASLTFTPDNWNEWQNIIVADANNAGTISTKAYIEISAPGYRGDELILPHSERHGDITVSANNDSYGTVTPNSSSATCVLGEPTPISAVPNPGYRFTGWTVPADNAPVTIADPTAPNTTMIKYYDNSTAGDGGDGGGIQANFATGSTGPALITIERDCQSIYVPAGGTTNMRIRLSAQPAATVTVNRRKTKDSAIWFQQSSFTFTTTNWSQWQTVTLGCSEHDSGRVPTDHGGGEISRQDEIVFSGTGLVSARVHVYEGDKCALTIWSGIGGVAVTPSGKLVVKKGWSVPIRARANTGFRFDRWVVNSREETFSDGYGENTGTPLVTGDNVMFDDEFAANTTVRLECDANIRAEFVRIDTPAAPDCALVSPVGHVAVKAGTNLTLAATASAAPGATVSKVEFYREGVRIGEDVIAPYSCVWSNVPVGTYTVTARATDGEGLAGAPATVWVTATADGLWNGILASGGDEMYDYMTNGVSYRAHKFTSLGSAFGPRGFVVNSVGTSNQVEYLVVAGGGGGGYPGSNKSGGGGAGGMLTGTTNIAAGAYTVTVGAGGRGGDWNFGGVSENGQNSVFGGITTIGGGRGASWIPQVQPGAGGSGGGNVKEFSGNDGGAGTPGQGYKGGDEVSIPGGGGGAGGPGTNGIPGPGALSGLSGSNVIYAAGGCGRAAGAPVSGADGAPNTGNGGEGGCRTNSGVSVTGGDGGSGIVIVRYVIPAAVYPVIYQVNGATGGTIPTAQTKTYGSTLTLAANTGSLVRTGYGFAGWNTAANGAGTDYAAGAAYTANAGVTLYAKWTAASYLVTYDANYATGGTVPATQTKTNGVSLTLSANTSGLVRTGFALAGWNTEASGMGTDYALGSNYTANADVTLYARWLVSGSRPPEIVTPAFASTNPVSMPPGTTTVGVVFDANGGGPLSYEWSQVSGPGTATFSSPGTPDSAVAFSGPGIYLLRVTVVNVRGETISSEVTVTVNGIFTDTSSVSVPEGGTNTFLVKLVVQPVGTVTVTVARASGDTNVTVQSGGSLTFTTNNWGTYQTVTLAALEDGDTDGGSASISLSSAGMSGAPVTATEADNDTTLWVNAGTGGSVSPAGQMVVTKGVPMSLVATVQSGNSFSRWAATDGLASFSDPNSTNTTVTISAPAIVHAIFSSDESPLYAVYAWGFNTYGQLGDGTTVNRSTPVKAKNVPDVMQVALGGMHSVACSGDRRVWTWGNNMNGQIGNGTTTNCLAPVRLSGISNVVSVGAGDYHTVALKSDGSVWAWGANFRGQLGNGTYAMQTSPVQVLGISNVVSVWASAYQAVALKSDGSIWGWGNNEYGQLGGSEYSYATAVPISGLTQVVAIAAEPNYTVALNSDGSVWALGRNDCGQLGDGTTEDSSTPVPVSGLTQVVAIVAVSDHTAALKSDGTVWKWGHNDRGQLGDGTTNNSSTPVQAYGLSNVTAVSSGIRHSVALKSDGSVWAWGYNYYGQLGDGTKIDRSVPVQVSGLSDVVEIYCGTYYSMARKSDGSIWAWGYNTAGMLGDGTTVNQSTPVQVLISDAITIQPKYWSNFAMVDLQPSIKVLTDVTGAKSVPEGGTATFQAKLSSQPSRTITVNVVRAPGDSDITVQSATNLTFATTNWSTYQTVTLAAAQDADAENGSAVISLMGAGVDVDAAVTAVESDNDTPLTVGSSAGGAASPVGTTNVGKYAGTAIVATPAGGYVFDNWSVVSGMADFDDSLTTDTTVTVCGPAIVQANFLPTSVNRNPTLDSSVWADSSTVRLPAGTTVHVRASDRDGDTLAYTWSALNNAENVTFATGTSADSAVTFSAAGVYVLSVTISDGRGGSVISDTTINVKPVILSPTITQHPADTTLCAGQEASVAVKATGEERVYQWYRNGVPISGAAGELYSIEAVTVADNGAKFKVLVTNPVGSVMSSEVTLTVLNEAVGTGLLGNYYNETNFTDLFLTRVDSDLSVTRFKSPFPLSTFSVRWTGQVRPIYSEAYTFESISQGGTKLWVDGVLLFDSWGVENLHNTWCQGTIVLEAGRKYDIQFEYGAESEQGGNALNWYSPHLITGMSYVPTSQMYPVADAIKLVTSASVVNVPEGGTNTFQVRLPAQPAGSVTVAVSRVSGDADLTVQSGTNLTFTTNNWNTYQLVTLAAANDADISNNTATITCLAEGISNATVTAVEVDKSTTLTLVAGPGGTVSPVGATQVDRLVATQIVATAGQGYRFANWSLGIGSAAIGDVNAASTTVTIDAPATLLASFVEYLSIKTSVTNLSVSEGGTATFGVKLSVQPAGSVVVNVAPTAGDADITVQSGGELSFDAQNWSTYQTVTLAADEDGDLTNSTAEITCSAEDMNDVIIAVSETDNDAYYPPTGGAVTNYTVDGTNYTAHIFTTIGTNTFTITTPLPVEYLVVAGGGAGGGGNQSTYSGGGGGAGGFLSGSTTLTAQAYAIVVGAGGTAATANSGNGSGLNGQASSIGAVVSATGGGGGGGGATSGRAGGSGGGAGGSTSVKTGGVAVASQGYEGGDNNTATGRRCGGGGGAGGVGTNATSTAPGRGGIGKQSSLSGETNWYAGGGGGGQDFGTTGAAGGLGGGSGGSNAVSGTANTGGGGGGKTTGGVGTTIKAGDGGSGIVIIRYVAGSADGTTYLTVTAGTGGTTDPSGATVVTQGVARAIAATTNAGYTFANWTVTSGSATIAEANAVSTTVTISSPATIQANFTPDNVPTTTLTVTAGTGGTTVPSGATVVTQGVARTIAATTNAGYTFANWTVESGLATIADDNAASTTVTISDLATIRANFNAIGGSISATGGIVTNYTENGTNYTAHIFTNTASASTLTVTVGGNIEYLIVGGGGGGGGRVASTACGHGGGGGGDFIVNSGAVSVETLTINVGYGGAGNTDGRGQSGGASLLSCVSLGSISAIGGGGGGNRDSTAGLSGGSGGGGGVALGARGSHVGVRGNYGGYGGTNTTDLRGGGGGGGALSAGLPLNKWQTSDDGGNGGAGMVSLLSGVSNTYSSGGGGGSSTTAGKVGGTAGVNAGNGGSAASKPGANAVAGFGGGGGGASGNTKGGNGGSGIVIIRYVAGQALTPYQIWQQTYFTADQLTNSAISGDDADPDHDRMNNRAEYLAATNPNDGTSWLGFTGVSSPGAPGEFVVRWQSATGRVYTVMGATNLVDGFNLILGTNIPATPMENVYTDNVGNVGQKFYRVELETGN